MLLHPVFSQHYKNLIQISKRCRKHPTLYFIFTLGKHQFKIKEVGRDNKDNYISPVFLFKCFGSWNKGKNANIIS